MTHFNIFYMIFWISLTYFTWSFKYLLHILHYLLIIFYIWHNCVWTWIGQQSLLRRSICCSYLHIYAMINMWYIMYSDSLLVRYNSIIHTSKSLFYHKSCCCCLNSGWNLKSIAKFIVSQRRFISKSLQSLFDSTWFNEEKTFSLISFSGCRCKKTFKCI